jgi:hypothetical protein
MSTRFARPARRRSRTVQSPVTEPFRTSGSKDEHRTRGKQKCKNDSPKRHLVDAAEQFQASASRRISKSPSGAIFVGFGRVGKGALAPCPPAESTQPIVPIGFGGHGAKERLCPPYGSVSWNRTPRRDGARRTFGCGLAHHPRPCPCSLRPGRHRAPRPGPCDRQGRSARRQGTL